MTAEGQVTRRTRGWRRQRPASSRDGRVALTAEAVWQQLTARAATERPALMRSYLAQLAPDEVAQLLALSEVAARREVLDRLAQRELRPWQ